MLACLLTRNLDQLTCFNQEEVLEGYTFLDGRIEVEDLLIDKVQLDWSTFEIPQEGPQMPRRLRELWKNALKKIMKKEPMNKIV